LSQHEIVQLDGSSRLPALDSSLLKNLTGAAAGTYGSPSNVPLITVDTSGRITNISSSSLTALTAVSGATLTSGNLWLGNSSNSAIEITMSGDATMSNSGTLTLSASGVTAGTYNSVIVDTKGRVTAGSVSNSGASQWITSGSNIYYTTNSTGNVGIGANSPQAKLQIKNLNSVTNTIVNEYIHLGDNNQNVGGFRLIGFGYSTSEVYSPAYIGFQDMSATGSGNGDLIFGTRSATTDTTASERMRISSTGNVGISTTSPSGKLDVKGDIRITGLSSGYVGFSAPTTVTTPIVWTLPNGDGTPNQVLTTNGTGLLSWQSAESSVTSITTGNGLLGGPIISTGTILVNTGTGVSQIVQLDSSARLPAVDGSQLTNLNLSNTTGSLNLTNTSGSLNLTNTSGTLSVTKGGTGLTAGTSGGIPYYIADNTMASSPALTLNGIIYGGGAGGSPLSTTALIDGQIIVGKTGGFAPQVVTMGGDATISNSGTLTLAASGVTAGTYTQVTVDAKGRVISGTLTSAGTGSSQWITSGSNIYYTTGATGNVGIGTTTPNQKLDIKGNINVGTSNAYMYNGTKVITAITTLDNYFFGNAGNLTTTGTANIAIGNLALSSNSTGTSNSAIGDQALKNNNSGTDNAAIGFHALTSNVSGAFNNAIGSEALSFNNSGNYNNALGYQSLLNNIDGIANDAIGYQALSSNGSGNYNVAHGYKALYLNSGGNSNVAIGNSALLGNTIGNNNIAIGDSSLSNLDSDNNIGVGFNAGIDITTGSNNVIIGGNAGTSIATLSNYIIISDGTGNELMRITPLGYVGIGTTSPQATLDVAGHISNSAVTAGTVSSCGTTPPAVVGNDTRGRITYGTGTATKTCTLTFASAYNSAPYCTVSQYAAITAGAVSVTSTSTTQLVIAWTTAVASVKFNYICIQ
jgi:hypothetical protein